MIRCLVMGDFHIPTRASEPPKELLDFVYSENFDYILITGDLVRFFVIEKWFNEFWRANKVVGVYGNMDYKDVVKRFPEIKVLSFEECNYKIVLYHGTEIFPRGDPSQLASLAEKFNAKVIITGHTHAPVLKSFRDVVIINPGSATGCLGGSWDALGIPSFSFVKFESTSIIGKIYVIQDFEIKCITEKEFKI